jgi:hypothetical protein
MINSKVKTFKYLGNTILIYGNVDLENKMNNFNKIGRSIRRNFGTNKPTDVQLRINKIRAKPVLMLGSEMWLLKSKDKRFEARQTRFFR